MYYSLEEFCQPCWDWTREITWPPFWIIAFHEEDGSYSRKHLRTWLMWLLPQYGLCFADVLIHVAPTLSVAMLNGILTIFEQWFKISWWRGYSWMKKFSFILDIHAGPACDIDQQGNHRQPQRALMHLQSFVLFIILWSGFMSEHNRGTSTLVICIFIHSFSFLNSSVWENMTKNNSNTTFQSEDRKISSYVERGPQS